MRYYDKCTTIKPHSFGIIIELKMKQGQRALTNAIVGQSTNAIEFLYYRNERIRRDSTSG